MAELPRVTEQDVERWVDSASFDRGLRYARRGAIINPRRQGSLLRAQCKGSQLQPYRVAAELGSHAIVSANCTCPIGAGGRCKHVVALLLTWLDDAESFIEVEDVESALRRRSKDELIALISTMVRRHPDLELLLDLPMPGPTAAAPVSREVIRRHARQAFAEVDYEWGAAAEVADRLEELTVLAERYAAAGDWRSATLVYRTVAEETLPHYEGLEDEGGELIDIVGICIEGLGDGLASVTDPGEREAILRVLFQIYAWDIDVGGVGMADLVPDSIRGHATREEQRLVVTWLREVLPRGDSWGESWQRQAFGWFLLQLQRDELDDESYLQVCRETGRRSELVERLLQLGRVDEAIAEVRSADDFELLSLAPTFVRHHQAHVLEELVRERVQAHKPYHLIEWLKERAVIHGDVAEALELTEVLFWKQPSPALYRDLGQIAHQLGHWPRTRSRLLERLAREQHHELLTEIYLLEGEISLALEALAHVDLEPSPWAFRWEGESLSVRVARAAEASHPREALRLYESTVQQLIAARGRDAYATAARYLLRVRALYQRLSEETSWRRLIEDLRTQHKRLRALQEELKRAGL